MTMDKASTIGANPTYPILDDDTMATATDRTLVTAESIKAYVDREVIEVVEAEKALSATLDSGKTFMLKNAAGFTVTMPSIATAGAGWKCRLIVRTAPTTSGGYVITELATADTDKIITNGINELEVDAGDDGPYNAGHTTVTFVHDVALAGDYIDILCDGTNYFVTGQTKADGGVALA